MTQSFDVDSADLGLLTIQRYSEEEDGNFYDSYLDQNNVSRSLTPSPNIQDDEFCEESEEFVDTLALSTPAELEDRLRSIKPKKRSRSSTVTLRIQNMYEREPRHSDNVLPESDDEEVRYESSGSSEWEPY